MTVQMTILPSRFYSFRNLPIRYITIHRTEGTDSRTWLTETGGVSAHYLTQGKVIYRLVGHEWASWNAGIISGTPTSPLYTGHWEDIYENGVYLGGGWTVNPNDENIGIEIEGYSKDPLTPDELATVVALIQNIREVENQPLPINGHYELSPGNRSDPGQANLQKIKDAMEENDMFSDADRALLQRVKDLLEAREPMVWDARQQRNLDVETGLPYDPLVPPHDKRIMTAPAGAYPDPALVPGLPAGSSPGGMSADGSEVLWIYPDHSQHWYVNGVKKS